jgi:uncharacterized protein
MAQFELFVNGVKTGVKILKADTLFSKFLGLMGRNNIDYGLLIPRCASIHTFFMKITIDAVFTDSRGIVVKLAQKIQPWRIVLPVRGASNTLELNSGTASTLGIKEKDIVTYQQL